MSGAMPTLEVVIAVHDRRRPVGRAVASVLDGAPAGRVRVTVVVHNRPREEFDDLAARFRDAPVRILDFSDDTRSPAGPFNFGVASATGDYVGLLGSDDRFEEGAVSAALARIDRSRPDVLVYPLRHDGRPPLPNPLARRHRTERLDPIRDRLMYRTAPLAFVRRERFQQEAYRFTPGMPTGEDVETSARLWFTAPDIAFHPADPGYVVMDDGPERVTFAPRPVDVELAPFTRLLERDWVRALPVRSRRAIVIKTMRVHALGILFRRQSEGGWQEGDLAAFRRLCALADATAPRWRGPFALADAALLHTAETASSTEQVDAAVRRRNAAGRLRRWVPANPLLIAHREAPLRRLVRYASWP